MRINYIEQIDNLIKKTTALHGTYNGKHASPEVKAKCKACLASANNLVSMIFAERISNPYSDQLRSVEALFVIQDYISYEHIQICTEVLINLKNDIENGLVETLEDKVTAENFDDFLDHAEAYYNDKKIAQAGVIAGVVFEDTIRKICKKFEIEISGQKLENLINSLKRENYIEKTKSFRCKVGAAVRGTAAHANWEELDEGSVRDTILLTRELLGEFLER